jgi:ATP-dependent Clp protease ATP-binding subunit ClpA
MERIFSPEFRNRLDEVVVFSPLTSEEVRGIAERHLQLVENAMKPAGKNLIVTPEALEKLVSLGYSYAYGARFLKRTIDEKIKIPITNLWNEGDTFIAEMQDDQIVVHPLIAELI